MRVLVQKAGCEFWVEIRCGKSPKASDLTKASTSSAQPPATLSARQITFCLPSVRLRALTRRSHLALLSLLCLHLPVHRHRQRRHRYLLLHRLTHPPPPHLAAAKPAATGKPISHQAPAVSPSAAVVAYSSTGFNLQ